MIAAVIAITQGQRKITVQYAKRVVAAKCMAVRPQYMPLKVNYAGCDANHFRLGIVFVSDHDRQFCFSKTVRPPRESRQRFRPAGRIMWSWLA